MSQIISAEAARPNANSAQAVVFDSNKPFPQETVEAEPAPKSNHWNDYADLVKTAEYVADLWNKDIQAVFSGRGETQIRVVSAIYDVCWAFRDNDTVLKSFLKDRGETYNGNVQNWVQPVVKTFMKRLHESSKSQITKIAGAIRLGIDNSITPDDYPKFLTDNGGYCKAYQYFLDTQPKNGDREHMEKVEYKELVDAFLDNDSSPETEAPEELYGCVGQQVVIIEMTEPGQQYRILRRLDLDESQLERLLQSQAIRHVDSTQKEEV